MRFHTLIVDTTNGIATITVNRPDKLNALNELVFPELDQVLDQIRDRSDIQSALITGSGDKAFVAGADIREFNATESDRDGRRRIESIVHIESLDQYHEYSCQRCGEDNVLRSRHTTRSLHPPSSRPCRH